MEKYAFLSFPLHLGDFFFSPFCWRRKFFLWMVGRMWSENKCLSLKHIRSFVMVTSERDKCSRHVSCKNFIGIFPTPFDDIKTRSMSTLMQKHLLVSVPCPNPWVKTHTHVFVWERDVSECKHWQSKLLQVSINTFMQWYWIYGVCVNLPELDHRLQSYLRLTQWRNQGSSPNILEFTTCLGRGIGFILEGYTSRIVKFKNSQSKQGGEGGVPQTTEYALISPNPLKTDVFWFAYVLEIFYRKKACKLVVCFSSFLYSILSLRLKKYIFPAQYFLRQFSFVFLTILLCKCGHKPWVMLNVLWVCNIHIHWLGKEGL